MSFFLNIIFNENEERVKEREKILMKKEIAQKKK